MLLSGVAVVVLSVLNWSQIQAMPNDIWLWLGIIACLALSGVCSGLTIAYFSISRLRLEIERDDDPMLRRIWRLRLNGNFLLAVLLWANNAVNQGLGQLSGQALTPST